MNKFSNPLAEVKVASPCPANWAEMQGDERQRYCSECKLNVYNLSDMTRAEAENFIINAEGRVCVKFYRRADGSVLTKDCPVGWQAFKAKTSRMAKAFISICAGLFGGIFAFNQLQPNRSFQNESPANFQSENPVKVSAIDRKEKPNPLVHYADIPPSKYDRKSPSDSDEPVVGMMIAPEPPPKQKRVKKARRR